MTLDTLDNWIRSYEQAVKIKRGTCMEYDAIPVVLGFFKELHTLRAQDAKRDAVIEAVKDWRHWKKLSTPAHIKPPGIEQEIYAALAALEAATKDESR